MARPKKDHSEQAVPTRDRILSCAIELFSRAGYEGVSIRDIARAVQLNEASLYNHFASKAALLDAVLIWLEDHLIAPGLSFDAAAADSLEHALLQGAQRFFARADPQILEIWRILIIEQYRNSAARRCVQERLLAAPREYFAALFQSLERSGRLRRGVDIEAAANLTAAMFFEFSFEANLNAAWDRLDAQPTTRLHAQISLLAQMLAPP